MPIKNLTDRGLAFPQIGVIRKGSPKQKKQNADGSEYSIQGKDLKFFRVEFDEAEDKARKAFVEKYGNEPVFMNATFPFNEIDRVWSAWLEAYTSNRLIARSDGEIIIYWREGKEKLVKDGLATVTREMKIWRKVEALNTEPLVIQLKEGQPVPYVENMVFHRTEKTLCEAKPVGRLRVVIPELNRLGYLLLQTTSMNDIIALGGPDSGELGAIKMLCDQLHLPLAGVPLILRRKPKEIAYTDGKGKQSRMTRWLVHIEADPEYVAKVMARMRELSMPVMALLEAAVPQKPELRGVNEPEEIDEEEIPTEIPEDFSEGEEVTPTPSPEPVQPVKISEPKYAWNSEKIIHAVKKITSYSNQEAAATMSEAVKKNMVAKELTVAEAEKFARGLVTPA